MEGVVRRGDLKQLLTLIRSGVEVKEQLHTLLAVAIEEGHQDIAFALLEVGARADVPTEEVAQGENAGSRVGMSSHVGKRRLSRSLLNEQDRFGRTLLMLAAQSGSVEISMRFLQGGASCKGLSEDQMNGLLHRACANGDAFVAEGLITAGCNVNSAAVGAGGCTPLMVAARNGHEEVALLLLRISTGANVHVKDSNGQTVLHWACDKGKGKLVQALIDKGAGVNEQDRFARTPLMMARVGDTAVSMCILRAGASCGGLSKKELNDLYHHACQKGDMLAIQTLLLDGGLRLKVEQENLLHHACRVGNALVEIFIASGCNINCVDTDGLTPLMVAACEGQEEVVKMLILAGANVGRQDNDGDTALHHAARKNNIECGILLAEGGASVRTKSKVSHTPLSISKPGFKETIQQALSFTTRKTLCIIGNAESGKSTLIAALQAESTGLLGRIFNRLRRVSDQRRRTAGIEIITHCSQKYGEVLFFDFAGQHEYHGPHQTFLESLLSKPGVLMTLLLVVKATDEEEVILHQLHRWLSPVALMSTTNSCPQVIVIGSFLDKVKSKEEATAKLIGCISATKKDLEELPITFVGSCFLNCRQPQSQGIDQLCSLLQDIPIPEFRATHSQYSLAWVLSQIRLSFNSHAVQLREFSAWIQDNKNNLPQTMPPPEEVCQDLSAAGHTLYLPNKEESFRSWLVLDLPSILHDVYGTLFSQSKATVNEFGLLHCHHLADLFQHLDQEMLQQLLVSLEFCIPVDPSVLEVEVSKLTQSEEASGWLFFPALISPKSLQPTSEGLQKQSVRYQCWQLKTSKKHSISARVLQTILLRLAAHFVVKQCDEEGDQRHCCSIWWNGIAWKSKKGIVVTVCIANNRVIRVVGESKTSAENSCRYLTDVISEILSIVRRLSPKLAAAAYIVHPPNVAALYKDATAPSPQELFPVADIRNSIRDHEEYSFSLKPDNYHSTDVLVSDLFGGYTPSQEDIERITWTTQPDLNQTSLSHPSDHAISGVVDPQVDPLDECPQMAESPSPPTARLVMPPSPPTAMPSPKPTHIDSSISRVQGAQALLDVSSKPTLRHVDELVVTPVASHWTGLALKLGVEFCVVDIIFRNHPNDCEGACRDMFSRWLRGDRHTGEEERTWSTLLTTLGRAGYEELDSFLRKRHFKADKFQ